jgi:hypothetical protein
VLKLLPKFSPADSVDIVLLAFVAGISVLAVPFFAAGAVASALARHGLDTLSVIAAICFGIALLLAVYGLIWGREHANVISRLACLAGVVGVLVGLFPVSL